MNEFVDMHVHSKFSIDGMSTMEDYCLIAGKTGTRVICFTEHVDFNSAEKNLSIVKDNRKQNFVVSDGHKPMKICGSNSYPYNFNKFLELLGIEPMEGEEDTDDE